MRESNKSLFQQEERILVALAPDQVDVIISALLIFEADDKFVTDLVVKLCGGIHRPDWPDTPWSYATVGIA